MLKTTLSTLKLNYGKLRPILIQCRYKIDFKMNNLNSL